MSRGIRRPAAVGTRGVRVTIVDDTWIDAPPAEVANVVADPRNFSIWWPHLRPSARLDRGVKGQRWEVEGQVVGTLGVWLEPFWEGTILHHYVRGARGAGAPRDVRIRHTLRWKRSVLALKDTLESACGRGL